MVVTARFLPRYFAKGITAPVREERNPHHDLGAYRGRGTARDHGLRAAAAGRHRSTHARGRLLDHRRNRHDAARFADSHKPKASRFAPCSLSRWREDLLVAATPARVERTRSPLEPGFTASSDHRRLKQILTRSLTGYAPDAPGGGRLWIESWHFGLRDQEMRADALRDNTAWRQLVASVVRRGIEQGVFSGRHDPDTVAVLAVAAADGMGIPLSLGYPDTTARGAVHDVLAALRELLRL